VWRRRLGVGAEVTTFREVAVRRTTHAPTESAPFELEFTSGVRMRVLPSFEADPLVRLREALAQANVC